MISSNNMMRQKSLFDTENTDEVFYRQEMKKKRLLELAKREQEAIEEYNKKYQEKNRFLMEMSEEEYLAYMRNLEIKYANLNGMEKNK